jgi:ribosomal protein S18 acetylase RimI-like enzyme
MSIPVEQGDDFADADYLEKDFYLHRESPEELRSKLNNPSWVADEEGVIGCIITCPDADKTLIWSIIVAPSYRRMGIGWKLMDAAESFYRRTKLTLHVEPANPARRLYFKRGYRASRIIKDYFGQGYDAIEMYKYCD